MAVYDFAVDNNNGARMSLMQTQEERALSNYRSWQLVPGASSGPAATLMWSDELPDEIVANHNVTGKVSPVSMYEIVDATYGGHGLVSVDGRLYLPRECYPGYLEPMAREFLRAERNHRWFGALFSSRPRRISCARPILAPFHPNLIYGHFLIEMLPRLLLADKWDTSGAPLALCRRSPRWLQEIVATVVPSREIIWFDSRKEILTPEAVLIPSIMLSDRQHFHPLTGTLIAELKQRLGVDGKRPADKRLYLSRTRKPDKEAWHKLQNERAIERVFGEFGFEVIHPQELDFRQQVSLFDTAAIIAGEFSSALHNSLFARPGCSVFAINWINWNQSRISTLMDQSVAYFPPIHGFRDWRTRESGFQRLEVDLEHLRRKLDAFLQARAC